MRVALAVVVTLFLSAPVSASQGRDGARIVNSGSTNSAGWTLLLWSDGAASVTVGSQAARPLQLGETIAAFFHDAKAAKAAGAQGGGCMKSASFGTTLRVEYHGWSSPDLSCPQSDPKVHALALDANAIVQAAKIEPPLRRPPTLHVQTPKSL